VQLPRPRSPGCGPTRPPVPRGSIASARWAGAAIRAQWPREARRQTPSDLARPAGFEPATRCW